MSTQSGPSNLPEKVRRQLVSHRLVERELTDTPGRCESWEERVLYLGQGRWRLTVEGTTFNGRGRADGTNDLLSTRKLLTWVIDRDQEDAEGESGEAEDGEDLADEDDGAFEDDAIKPDDNRRHLGERSGRLLEIARLMGATYCVNCLRGYAAGSWPRRQLPKVLSISGVTSRAIWFHIRHTVLDVCTSAGPGYLYPPDSRRNARLALKSNGSHSMGTTVRLTAALAAQAVELFQHRQCQASD